MAGELTWSLGAIKQYTPGAELPADVVVTAPVAGSYYLVGGLYDSNLNLVSGTYFGILQTEGTSEAVNSATDVTVQELEEDEVLELDVVFTLTYSGYTLGLFLYRMVGDNPSLADDVLVDSVSTALSSPAQVIDLESLMIAVVAVGMMGIMMSEALGGE